MQEIRKVSKKSKTISNRENNPWQVWLARFLILIILFWNLQCAILFTASPMDYVPSFQLTGVPGRAAVAGMGILFLMWQVPYILAAIHPVKFKISLWEAFIMQLIGAVAETSLLAAIPNEFTLLRDSIIRFIVFDGLGVLLLLAAILVHREIQFKN